MQIEQYKDEPCHRPDLVLEVEAGYPASPPNHMCPQIGHILNYLETASLISCTVGLTFFLKSLVALKLCGFIIVHLPCKAKTSN